MSNTLFTAIVVVREDEIVADFQAKRYRLTRDFFDADDFEFCGFYLRVWSKVVAMLC